MVLFTIRLLIPATSGWRGCQGLVSHILCQAGDLTSADFCVTLHVLVAALRRLACMYAFTSFLSEQLYSMRMTDDVHQVILKEAGSVHAYTWIQTKYASAQSNKSSATAAAPTLSCQYWVQTTPCGAIMHLTIDPHLSLPIGLGHSAGVCKTLAIHSSFGLMI